MKNVKVEWKHITSAPKNEQILLMQGRNRICQVGKWSEQYLHWSTGAGLMAYLAGVTHWASLDDIVDEWDRKFN